MRSMVKEFAIIIAMIILAILVLGISFYDYIPTYKTVPQVKKYVADNKISAALEEIREEEVDSLIVKPLTIDSNELDAYEARNSYEKGKNNPFSDYSVIDDSTNATETNASSSTTQRTENGTVSSNSTNTTNKNETENTTSESASSSSSSSNKYENGGKFLNSVGTK